jgi:hypothetical protein
MHSRPSSNTTPASCLPPLRCREAIGAIEGNKRPSFSWEALVPFLVHPIKVVIVEAMLCIERPLSATDVKHTFDKDLELSLVSYHMVSLAKTEVIVKKRERRVRGAIEKFYFLR